jgi:DNA-binding NarL/FixJ family response regulator
MNDIEWFFRNRHINTTPTKTEFAIIRLVAEGLDNKAIASKLSLSEKTVERHLTNIYDKLEDNDIDFTGKHKRVCQALFKKWGVDNDG